MKKKYLIGAIAIILCFVMAGCASVQRSMKSFGSNVTGGLDRTVTVYSYDGTPIQSWSGRFDVSESEAETFFDVNGKRVVIQGGIVINEEN